MSKKGNRTLIGLFVLGAVALAILAVIILGSGRLFHETRTTVMYFEGSVKGLSVGAPVVFRGVKIGSVSDIRIHYDPQTKAIQIPVYAEFPLQGILPEDPATGRRRAPGDQKELLEHFIKRGLRAQLEMQSIVTGQVQIGLDFYPDRPAKLVGVDPDFQEIPTIPSPLQQLTKQIEELPLQEIIQRVSSSLQGIDRVVNSPEITRTVQSIAQAAEEAKHLVQNLDAKAGPVASGIEAAVIDMQKAVRNINEKIDPLASGLDEGIKDLRKLARNLDDRVGPVSSDIQTTLKDAQTLLREMNGKVTSAASALEEGIKDVQRLAGTIEQEVRPVSGSLQKTLASIEATSGDAGVTLQEARRTLQNLGGGIGEDSLLLQQVNQTLVELRAASRAIRDLADGLDRQPESLIFGRKKVRKEIDE